MSDRGARWELTSVVARCRSEKTHGGVDLWELRRGGRLTLKNPVATDVDLEIDESMPGYIFSVCRDNVTR